MKSLLPFLFLSIFSGTLYSQINREHTYTDEGAIERIDLSIIGEVYVHKATQQNKVVFFGPDHSYIATIDLIVPENAVVHKIHVSQTKLNDDANIEVIYSCAIDAPGSADDIYWVRVMNQNNELLLDHEGFEHFEVDETDGLPPVLIMKNYYPHSMRLYHASSLDFALEIPAHAVRYDFGIEGSTYMYREYNVPEGTVGIKLYNSEFELWKTLSFEFENPTFNWVPSQTFFNEDADLEFTLRHNFQSTSYEGLVVDEAGNFLTIFPNTERINYSKIEGVENKLVVHKYHGTSVVNPINFEEEAFTNERYLYRVLFPEAGTKFYQKGEFSMFLYNEDLTSWKEISAGGNFGYPPPPWNDIQFGTPSQHSIIEDDKIEVIMIYKDWVDDHPGKIARILNEDGIQFVAKDCQTFYVSDQEGLAPKLICTSSLDGSRPSKVYNLHGNGLEEDTTPPIDVEYDPYLVFPNPFTDNFTVSLDFEVDEVYSLIVVDVLGTIYLQQENLIYDGQNPEVDSSTWPVGHYIMGIQSANTVHWSHLIKGN